MKFNGCIENKLELTVVVNKYLCTCDLVLKASVEKSRRQACAREEARGQLDDKKEVEKERDERELVRDREREREREGRWREIILTPLGVVSIILSASVTVVIGCPFKLNMQSPTLNLFIKAGSF